MNEKTPNNSDAGKGDAPRNCFSKKFKDNYDEIDWNHHKSSVKSQEADKQQKSP